MADDFDCTGKVDPKLLEVYRSRFSPAAKARFLDAVTRFAEALARACLIVHLFKEAALVSEKDVVQADMNLGPSDAPAGLKKFREAVGAALFGAGVSNFFVLLYDPKVLPKAFQILTFVAAVVGAFLLKDGPWNFRKPRPERLYPSELGAQSLEAGGSDKLLQPEIWGTQATQPPEAGRRPTVQKVQAKPDPAQTGRVRTTGTSPQGDAPAPMAAASTEADRKLG